MSHSASDITSHIGDDISDADHVHDLSTSLLDGNVLLNSVQEPTTNIPAASKALCEYNTLPSSQSSLTEYNTQLNALDFPSAGSPISVELDKVQGQGASNSKLSMLSLSKLTSIQKQLDENKHLTGAPTAIASNTRFIMIGTSKGFVWVFDHFQSRHGVFGTQGQHRQETLQRGSVQAIDISPDGELCVVAHRSGHVVVWEVLPKTILKCVDDFHLKDNPNAPFIVQILLLNRGKLQFLLLNSNGGVCLATLTKTLIVWTCSTQWLFNNVDRPAIHVATLPAIATASGGRQHQGQQQQQSQHQGNSTAVVDGSKPTHVTEQYGLIAVAFEDRTMVVSLDPQIKIVSAIARDVTVRAGVHASSAWRPAPPPGSTPSSSGVTSNKQTGGGVSTADSGKATSDGPTASGEIAESGDGTSKEGSSSPDDTTHHPTGITEPTHVFHGSRDMPFYYRNAVVSITRGHSLQLFSAFENISATGGGSGEGGQSAPQLTTAPSGALGGFFRSQSNMPQQQKPPAAKPGEGGGAPAKPSFPVSLEKIATFTFASDILVSKWLNDTTFLVFTGVPASTSTQNNNGQPTPRYCVYVIDFMGLNLVEILPIIDIICPLTIYNNIVSRRPDKSFVTSFSSTFGTNSSALFVVLDTTAQQIAIGQVKLMNFIERINTVAETDWIRALSLALAAWKHSRLSVVKTVMDSLGGSSLYPSSNRHNTTDDDGDDDDDDDDTIFPTLSSESITPAVTSQLKTRLGFGLPSPDMCSLDEFLTMKQRMALISSQQNVSHMSNTVLSDRIIDILLHHVDVQLKQYANVGVKTIAPVPKASSSQGLDDLSTLDNASGDGGNPTSSQQSTGPSSPQAPEVDLTPEEIKSQQQQILYTTASASIDLCIRLQRIDILFKLIAPRFYKYGASASFTFIDILLGFFIHHHIPIIDDTIFDAIMSHTYLSVQFGEFLATEYDKLDPLLFPSLDALTFGTGSVGGNGSGKAGGDFHDLMATPPAWLFPYQQYMQHTRAFKKWISEHTTMIKPFQVKIDGQLGMLRYILRHVHPFYLLALSNASGSGTTAVAPLSTRTIPASLCPEDVYALFQGQIPSATSQANQLTVTYPSFAHHITLLDAMLGGKDCYMTKTDTQQPTLPPLQQSMLGASQLDGNTAQGGNGVGGQSLSHLMSAISSMKNQQKLLPVALLTAIFGQHSQSSVDMSYLLSAMLSLSLVDIYLHFSYASLHINKVLHQLFVHFNLYPQLYTSYQAVPPPTPQNIPALSSSMSSTSGKQLLPIIIPSPKTVSLIPRFDQALQAKDCVTSAYYDNITYTPSPVTASPPTAYTYMAPTGSSITQVSSKPQTLIQTGLRHCQTSAPLQSQANPLSALFSYIQQTHTVNHNQLLTLLYHYLESILSISTMSYSEKPAFLTQDDDELRGSMHPQQFTQQYSIPTTMTSPLLASTSSNTTTILPSVPTALSNAEVNLKNRYFGGSLLDNVNIAYIIPNLHHAHYQFAEQNMLWTLMISKSHPFWTSQSSSPTKSMGTGSMGKSSSSSSIVSRHPVYQQQFINCELTTATLYRAQIMSLLFTPEFIDFTTPTSNYYYVAQQQQHQEQSRHRRRRSSISGFFFGTTPPPDTTTASPSSNAVGSSRSIAIPQKDASLDAQHDPAYATIGADVSLGTQSTYPYLLPLLSDGVAFFSLLLNLFTTPDWLLFESTTYPFISQMISSASPSQPTSSGGFFSSGSVVSPPLPTGTSPSQAQTILTRSSSQVRPGTPSSIPKSFIPALAQAQQHSPQFGNTLGGSSPGFVSGLTADMEAGLSSLKSFLGYSGAKPTQPPPQSQQTEELIKPGSFQRTFSFSQKEQNLVPSSSKLKASMLEASSGRFGQSQSQQQPSQQQQVGSGTGQGKQTASAAAANTAYSPHQYRTIYTPLFPSPIPSVVNIITAIYTTLTRHLFPNIYATAFSFATKVDPTSPSQTDTTLKLLREQIYTTSPFDHFVLLLSFVHYCLQVDLVSVDELPLGLLQMLCGYACLAPDHHVMAIYYLSSLSIATRERISKHLPLSSNNCRVLAQPFSVSDFAIELIYSQDFATAATDTGRPADCAEIKRKLSTHRELLLLSLIPYLHAHSNAIVYLAETVLFSRALLSIYIDQRNFDKVLTSFISNVDELVNSSRLTTQASEQISKLSLTRTDSSSEGSTSPQEAVSPEQSLRDQLPWAGLLFDDTMSFIDGHTKNQAYDVNHVLLSTLPTAQQQAIAQQQESRQVLSHLSVDLFSYIAYELCSSFASGDKAEFDQKIQSVLSHLPHLTQVCPLGVIALSITLLNTEERHKKQTMDIFSENRAVLYHYLSLLFKAYEYSQTISPSTSTTTASSASGQDSLSSQPTTQQRSGLGAALQAQGLTSSSSLDGIDSSLDNPSTTTTIPAAAAPTAAQDVAQCHTLFQHQLSVSIVAKLMIEYKYTPPPRYKQLYLELMCEFSPHKVYHYISTHASFDIDHMLELCRRFKIHDATAYILERTGDLQGALDLLLQAVRKDAESFQSIVHKHLDYYRPEIIQTISLQHETFIKTCPMIDLPPEKPASPPSAGSAKQSKSKTKIRGQGGAKAKGASTDGPQATTAKTDKTGASVLDDKGTAELSTTAHLRGLPATKLFPVVVQKLLPQHRRLLSHSISACISLCQRTSEQQSGDGQQLWFKVLELLIKIERSIGQARQQSKSSQVILHPPLDVIISYQKQQVNRQVITPKDVSKQQQEKEFYARAIELLNAPSISHAYLDDLTSNDIVLFVLHSVVITHLLKTVQQALEFVRIDAVVSKLVTLYEKDTLGSFRHVFMLLLESQSYELNIVQSTAELIQNDKMLTGKQLLVQQQRSVNYSSSLIRLFTHSDQYSTFRKPTKGAGAARVPPATAKRDKKPFSGITSLRNRTMTCDICQSVIVSSSSLYLYGCGHVIHQSCATAPPPLTSGSSRSGPSSISADQSPCDKCRGGGSGSNLSRGNQSTQSPIALANPVSQVRHEDLASRLFMAKQQENQLRMMSYEKFINVSRSYESLTAADDAEQYAYLDDDMDPKTFA